MGREKEEGGGTIVTGQRLQNPARIVHFDAVQHRLSTGHRIRVQGAIKPKSLRQVSGFGSGIQEHHWPLAVCRTDHATSICSAARSNAGCGVFGCR